MKKILLPLLALLSLAASGQRLKKVPPPFYTYALHLSPLALLELDYTLLAGVEYRLKPKLGLVLEAGYIFGSVYKSLDGANHGKGFLIRPAARYYMGRRGDSYLQVQPFYKQVTHGIVDWLGKNCTDGIPEYERYQAFRYRRKIVGLNAIIGTLEPISRNGRVCADLYIGLGLRYKDYSIVGDPNACYNDNFKTTIKSRGFAPSVPGGIRLIVFLE